MQKWVAGVQHKYEVCSQNLVPNNATTATGIIFKLSNSLEDFIKSQGLCVSGPKTHTDHGLRACGMERRRTKYRPRWSCGSVSKCFWIFIFILPLFCIFNDVLKTVLLIFTRHDYFRTEEVAYMKSFYDVLWYAIEVGIRVTNIWTPVSSGFSATKNGCRTG